jgi:thiamine biosynthesis lipoprotein ApbE
MKPLLISATALLIFTASFASVGASVGRLATSAPWRTSHYENVLGTSMEIKLLATSEPAADRAEAAALDEIKRLNDVLSGYDPGSEFSRWAKTRGEAAPVSAELMGVLKLWDQWRVRSGGALNPAAEAIAGVWKQAEKTGAMPRARALNAAADAARVSQWSLDEKAGTATRLTGTPLMLNSFTKSYIVERAAEAALRTPGVTAAVVNIGGDLVVRGMGSDTINVADPRADAENGDPVAVLNIRDRAVATSGNYRRGFEIGGQHYSHIVDPRTGLTAEGIVGATVVAPNAVDAGALATAFCVLTPAESRKLAATVPGSEYMIVARSGARYFSANWNSLAIPQTHLLAAAYSQSKGAGSPTVAKDSGLWNPGYELTVNVEIPQTQGFGARRPYVAVWVEDKDHYPVRTLAVLFEKARWLNELHAWYRDDRLRAMSEGNEILNSVTSATRAPGKYTFKWDGKDNSGKLVKEGTYTVLVEAAREHGGYNLDRHEINFNGAPVQAELPASGELGAVALDYHKVAH